MPGRPDFWFCESTNYLTNPGRLTALDFKRIQCALQNQIHLTVREIVTHEKASRTAVQSLQRTPGFPFSQKMGFNDYAMLCAVKPVTLEYLENRESEMSEAVCSQPTCVLQRCEVAESVLRSEGTKTSWVVLRSYYLLEDTESTVSKTTAMGSSPGFMVLGF
jgi:hypothetical protein